MAEKKLLITGAAGRIGRSLREQLCGSYQLRLMYHHTVLPAAAAEEVVVGAISDLDFLQTAVAGVDAIVHLAGDPSLRASWESVLEANVQGTYCVYEAARRQGVRRVVFASTNHVTGYYEKDGIYTTPDMPERPDSLYGASKAFGEDLGRYFVDAFGLEVFCLRIGSFQPDDAVVNRKGDRILSTWLSHRDCAQLVRRCIEVQGASYGIFYGISANKRAYWDITNARQVLGYEPEDDAETLI